MPKPSRPFFTRTLSRMRLASVVPILTIGLLTISLFALPACSTSPFGGKRTLKTPANPDEPLKDTAIGDWNDVEASVEVSLMKTELALLSTTPAVLPDGSKSIKFELLATDDSIVTLLAKQSSPGAGELEKGTINFEVITLPKRDLERETRLIQAVTKRLTTLAGVEWAPIR